MLLQTIRKVWRLMPESLRYRAVRITQQKFTASAAAVIINENNEVLILDHVLRPYSGWGLPGGFIEPGEQPHEAIVREVMEETGIELREPILFRVRVNNRHIEMMFKARASGTPEAKSAEIIEARWFAADDLPPKMSLAQKTIIAKVLKGEI